MATTNIGLKTFVHDEPIDFNDWNDNLVKIDTAVGEAKRGKAAYNLLDNSWFVNPVNQRGIASGAVITGWGYFIDRWKARAENCSVNFSGEGITVSTSIGQILPKETVKNGMTVTAAAKWSDGTICVASGAIRRTSEWSSFSSATINGHYLYVSDEGDGQTACITISEGTVVWAALYEGSYTADTLPAYVPKGYAAELAECQRHNIEYCVVPVTKIQDATFSIGTIIQMRDMGELIPTIKLKKFTRAGVIDITSFGASETINVERLGQGRYLLMSAYLQSCMDYDGGFLMFSISADM